MSDELKRLIEQLIQKTPNSEIRLVVQDGGIVEIRIVTTYPFPEEAPHE